MHPFMFRMKRASQASLRIGRLALKTWAPLTPARFDLLYVVHESPHGGIDQKELTKKLGLHHSTVGKMLQRLVELNLVQHAVSERDRRKRVVTLTAYGQALIAHAIREVRGNGYVDLAIARAILPLRWYDDVRVDEKIRRINGTLRRIALVFYDTAVPLYTVPRPFPPRRPRPVRGRAARWERSRTR